MYTLFSSPVFFFFQAEDGILYLVRSRGLGDVYKRQVWIQWYKVIPPRIVARSFAFKILRFDGGGQSSKSCLLYTSDAADERSSVDLGGRRIIKQKT